jgi:hypothetical protein
VTVDSRYNRNVAFTLPKNTILVATKSERRR